MRQLAVLASISPEWDGYQQFHLEVINFVLPLVRSSKLFGFKFGKIFSKSQNLAVWGIWRCLHQAPDEVVDFNLLLLNPICLHFRTNNNSKQ